MGRKISSRAKSTNRLPADRKNQSKVLVMAGRSQPKKAAAWLWNVSVHATNTTMVSPRDHEYRIVDVQPEGRDVVLPDAVAGLL